MATFEQESRQTSFHAMGVIKAFLHSCLPPSKRFMKRSGRTRTLWLERFFNCSKNQMNSTNIPSPRVTYNILWWHWYYYSSHIWYTRKTFCSQTIDLLWILLSPLCLLPQFNLAIRGKWVQNRIFIRFLIDWLTVFLSGFFRVCPRVRGWTLT